MTNNIKQNTQERIEEIKQEIYDLQLGVRLARNQEISDKVSKEIYPRLSMLERQLEMLERHDN
jgi:hypothetical protein